MSILPYKNYQIYYSVFNENQSEMPLVILNGIMMSSQSWGPILPGFGKTRPLITIDFIDQGQSSKAYGENYDHSLQVDVIIAVMKHIKYDKYHLFGISYGGQVALQIALKAPQLISKLIISNAASYTAPWLRDIGRGWIKSAKTYDPEHFYLTTIPYIYSNTFYNTNIEWMNDRKERLYQVFNQEFLDAMVRLIHSSESYDIRSKLTTLNIPTLIIGCDDDYLTPANETEALSKLIKNSKYIQLKQTGHASMYEQTTLFLTAINGFLATNVNINMI